MRLRIFALLVCAAAAPLSAQTATLVKDINTSGPAGDDLASSPRSLTPVGDKVFFFGSEPSSGLQVWVSDGTSAGTRELPVATFPEAGPYQTLGAMRRLFLWSLQRGSLGVTLFRSDGTRGGTFELFPRDTGLDTYGPDHAASVIAGDRLYFLGCQSGCRLWTSDGTVAGTQAVPGSPSVLEPSVTLLVPVGNRVYFFSDGSLWTSDGTAAGTHAVKAVAGARRLTAAGNRLFFTVFAAGIDQLWSSDGTAAGTIQVSRFSQVAPFPDQPFFLPAGNGLFFSARDSHGEALWQSDGTAAGTRRLTDGTTALPSNGLFFGTLAAANGRPLFLTPGDLSRSRLWTAQGGKAVALTTAPVTGSLFQGAAGRVYFTAGDGGHGFEPWVSDGTVAGTHLLKDLCRGACDAEVHGFVAGGGATYFANGSEIWKTDGTEAGTQRISAPGFTSSFSGFEAAEVGRTLFVSSDTPYGRELWLRDASGQDRLVTDIARDVPSSRPQELLRFGDRLFFTACDGTDRTLWQTSPAGDDATPLPGPSRNCLNPSTDSLPWGLVAGNLLYFVRKDDLFPSEPQLWRTDGTAAGTFQLTDLPNGVISGNDLTSGLQIRTLFQGKLLFATYRSVPGGFGIEEIWETDGTVEGTRKSQYIPDNFISVSFLRAVGSEIYFFAFESSTSGGLWRSDGTVPGTRMIAPLFTQSGADPQFVRLGNTLYFLANDATRRQLWHTDGTSAGTQPLLNVDGGPGSSYLAELTVFQGSLFLMTGDPDHETLWRSDGTGAGTTVVKTFPYAFRGTLPVHGFTAVGGKLFFSQEDSAHGTELWSTDGTPGGTALVKDIFPGPISSGPAWLTAAGGRLFFTAQDGAHGTELWESDGTAAGTRLVQDLAPEALSSSPGQLTVFGDRLFFTADDGQFGRELWSFPLTGPGGCQPSSAHLCLNGSRYQVDASWRDSQGNTGFGTAVPLSEDTGTFWFFSPGNVETVVKVLDGQGVNGHVWVFYGALSNVEYTLTVTDTQTGLTRRYFNPQGQLASVGDVHGFGPLGASEANRKPPVTVAAPSPLPQIAERRDKAAGVPCQPGAQQLCLNEGRFGVKVSWKDFQGHTGQGTAVPLSGGDGTTGTFWFFNAANVELVVKALDGRAVNGHFWIFFGALSNVEYTVTVTDSQTGTQRTYTNPSGRFASVADTAAF